MQMRDSITSVAIDSPANDVWVCHSDPEPAIEGGGICCLLCAGGFARKIKFVISIPQSGIRLAGDAEKSCVFLSAAPEDISCAVFISP
jgi:hypothetical protein